MAMRLLIIGHSLIHPRQWLQALEFAKQGHEVLAICPDYWNPHVFKLNERETQQENYQRLGVKILIHQDPPQIAMIYRYYLDANLLVKEFQPDWIYAYTEPCAAQSLWAVRKAEELNAKSIVFAWENLYRDYPEPFASWEKEVFQKASLVFCGNIAAVDIFVRKGYPFEKLRVIPHVGIDLETFRPVRTQEHYDCVYIGRFVYEKGIIELQKAITQLGLENILWVGDGPLKPTVGITKKYADYLQLANYFSSGKLTIQHPIPIDGWAEQCGYVSLEALACARPVISTISGSIPEYLALCPAAYLSNPKDITDIMKGILMFLDMPTKEYFRTAIAARKYIKENYSVEIIAKKTIDYMEHV